MMHSGNAIESINTPDLLASSTDPSELSVGDISADSVAIVGRNVTAFDFANLCVH